MDNHLSRDPGVAAVVDLAIELESDGAQPTGDLRRRDRLIGRDLEPLRNRPREQVLAWLGRVTEGKRPSLGQKVDHALRLGGLVLSLAGLFLGAAAAAAVLSYSGRRPVNVLHVLAVFVGLQILLVALLLPSLLPRTVLRRIPGAAGFMETLQLLSPGRLQRVASRYLPGEYRHRAEALLGASRAHRLLFGHMEKWLVVSSSQLFAVAFNGGALLCSLALVAFSDLAFAWSTTLQITSADIRSITGILSAPWAPFLPDAVPSQALIEASRYYRFGAGHLPASGGELSPSYLGGWWAFLLTAMMAYGLLPRLVLLAFSRWRLRRAVEAAIVSLPGVPDLLERMNREFVETRALEAELPGARQQEATVPARTESLRDRVCALVSWSGAPGDAESLSRRAAAAWGCRPSGLLEAGGAHSLADDRETTSRAAGTARGGGVIVFVRAWEPPLEEFLDFLRELRAALPGVEPIIVTPLAPGGAGERPEGRHLDIWRRGLMALGDPRLGVELLGDEA